MRPQMDLVDWQGIMKMHADQVVSGMSKLPRDQTSLADATATASAVQNSVFDDATKGMIVRAVNTLAMTIGETDAIPAQDRRSLRPQEHFHMESYFTENDWAVLQSQTERVDDKVQTLLNRCRSIGLVSLSEKTSVAVSCILILAHNKPISTSNAYNLMQSVKDNFKKARQ